MTARRFPMRVTSCATCPCEAEGWCQLALVLTLDLPAPERARVLCEPGGPPPGDCPLRAFPVVLSLGETS